MGPQPSQAAGRCHHVLSHEIVEACTDPDYDGFVVTTGCKGGYETCKIADVCDDLLPERVDGVLVAQYFSAASDHCVAGGGKDTKDKDKDKEKDAKDKDRDSPFAVSAILSGISRQLDDLARQLEILEQQSSPEGQPFIGQDERPAVGEQALSEDS